MLPKAYDPSSTEDRIYEMWEKSGAFTADNQSPKESFSIAMPPPNATGQLHLGHAVMLALQDIFCRFQRMRGREVLWLPGTDHAAIATESLIIKTIQKEEKIPDPRASLGREELIRRIAHFVEKSRGTIRGQIRKMGASCDWSRERYTLEPALKRCVNEVFTRMYRDGLIYRGHRIVNWDPALQTTVSDDEIVYEERREPFYTFRYGPFAISTSRPETKFGDKYVVMHPEDERYARYAHGDQFTCEWINGPVTATIIKDKAVDPSFGTGVMTITPWHDHVDFEIAEHHGLERQQIIGFDGKLLPVAGEFVGMRIEDARPKIVEKLQRKGLLVSTDEHYVHSIAVSQRGRSVIEPQIKEQWFIDVEKRVVRWKRRELSLKEVLQEVVKTGLITILPERFEKTYFHWIDNLRDWCISRQIWWGHRIPVWYRGTERSVDMHVGIEPPEGMGNNEWRQDPDTLDTWFSAALWTWSTLIETKLAEDPSLVLEEMLLRSPDFRKFHPTDVLETGYDILFFWVARMILMTTYVTGSMAELEYGQVPFDTVYLHGLVRTRDGRKMSKSDPETMIDPLDMIAKYGADALRLSMIVGQSPGNDTRLYEEKIAGYRNFVNKLWNASRFVLMECEKAGVDPRKAGDSGLGIRSSGVDLSLVDRALLSALQDLTRDVTSGLSEYRLSEVGERLYGFVWDFFCDWYLEFSKGVLNAELLVYALRRILLLLHPYCPFVTEELWAHVKAGGAGLLLTEAWPLIDERLYDDDAVRKVQTVIDAISAIRKLRAEQNIEAEKRVGVWIFTKTKEQSALLLSHGEHIKRMARVGELTVQQRKRKLENAVSAFLDDLEVHLSLEGLVDPEKERRKLLQEKEDLLRHVRSMQSKLQDQEFLAKAPPKVVEREKEKLRSEEDRMRNIELRLDQL